MQAAGPSELPVAHATTPACGSASCSHLWAPSQQGTGRRLCRPQRCRRLPLFHGSCCHCPIHCCLLKLLVELFRVVLMRDGALRTKGRAGLGQTCAQRSAGASGGPVGSVMRERPSSAALQAAGPCSRAARYFGASPRGLPYPYSQPELGGARSACGDVRIGVGACDVRIVMSWWMPPAIMPVVAHAEPRACRQRLPASQQNTTCLACNRSIAQHYNQTPIADSITLPNRASRLSAAPGCGRCGSARLLPARRLEAVQVLLLQRGCTLVGGCAAEAPPCCACCRCCCTLCHIRCSSRRTRLLLDGRQ